MNWKPITTSDGKAAILVTPDEQPPRTPDDLPPKPGPNATDKERCEYVLEIVRRAREKQKQRSTLPERRPNVREEAAALSQRVRDRADRVIQRYAGTPEKPGPGSYGHGRGE